MLSACPVLRQWAVTKITEFSFQTRHFVSVQDLPGFVLCAAWRRTSPSSWMGASTAGASGRPRPTAALNELLVAIGLCDGTQAARYDDDSMTTALGRCVSPPLQRIRDIKAAETGRDEDEMRTQARRRITANNFMKPQDQRHRDITDVFLFCRARDTSDLYLMVNRS